MRPQERLREPRRLLLWSICSPRSTPGLHDRRLQVPWEPAAQTQGQTFTSNSLRRQGRAATLPFQLAPWKGRVQCPCLPARQALQWCLPRLRLAGTPRRGGSGTGVDSRVPGLDS